MVIRRVATALAAASALALASAGTAQAQGEFIGPKGTLGKPAGNPAGPGEFVGEVNDMHVDPVSGDVFVLDSWNSTQHARVLRFSATGTFKSETAVLSAQRMFEGAYDMAIQRSAADATVGRILVATLHGLYAYPIDDLTAAPTKIVDAPFFSVAADQRDGAYYGSTYADPYDSSSRDILVKYSKTGETVRSWPRDVAVDSPYPNVGEVLALTVDNGTGDVYIQMGQSTLYKLDQASDGVVTNMWSVAPPALPPLPYQPQTTAARVHTANGVTRVWLNHSGYGYNAGANEKAVGIYRLGGLAPVSLLKVGSYSATPGPCGFSKRSGYIYGHSTVSADGRTWYIDHGNGTVQIIGPGATEPTTGCFEQSAEGTPVAKIKPVEGVIGTPVELSGEPSTDDGVIARYEWDLDADGAYDDATGKTTSRTLARGVHEIGLRVTDEFGTASSVAASVAVLPPAPVAKLAAAPATVEVGDSIELDASGSTGDGLTYRFDSGAGFQVNGASAKKSVSFTTAGVKTVRVELTDSDKRVAIATAQVTVKDKPAPPQPTPTATPITPAATPAPTPVPVVAGKVTIRSAKVSGSKLTVTLACADGTCSGSLGATGVTKKSFSLAAGKTSTVVLTVSPALRKRLAKGKVKVALTATVGSTNVKKTFSLTTKKAKR